MKYIKRPVIIEAIQFTGDNINEIWDAFGASDIYGPEEDDPNAYVITLEGLMRCSPGDWIIKGISGELYPCKPDIFKASYAPVPVRSGHDPLCSHTQFGHDDDCVKCDIRGCECDLIAKARADEREKAAQRISEAAERWQFSRKSGVRLLFDAFQECAAAVRGES